MLKINDLHVSYGKLEALHGINITVEKGSIISIIGSNGAGKTTLLNAISGIVNKEGTILMSGEPLSIVPHKVVKAGIVQVPEGRKIFDRLTVEENLRIGGYLNHNRQSIKKMMDEQYELFPILKNRKDQNACMLSGGEQQMLAISRGLLSQPKILLLDEPSLGLAPKIVEEVFNVIKNIRDKGITVLLVEQNAIKALKASDYGFILENGKITRTGSGSELLNDSAIAEAYLGKRKDKIEKGN